MKVLVTKCMCDVCGKEIDPSEERCMIAFGIGNWNDDNMRMSFESQAKDVCRSCYLTFLSLANNGDEAQKSDVKTIEEGERLDNSCDRHLVVDLWKKGWTYDAIVKKTRCTRGVVQSEIHKAIKAGATRNEHKCKETVKNDPAYKTVVDENGLVISMERV